MEGHFTENPTGRGMRAVATWFVQISDDFTFRCPSVSLPQQVSDSPTRCSLGVFYQVLARIYANGPHDLLLVANCSPFSLIFPWPHPFTSSIFSLLYLELVLQHTCNTLCWLSVLYPLTSVLGWDAFECNNFFYIYLNMPLLQNYNELEAWGISVPECTWKNGCSSL